MNDISIIYLPKERICYCNVIAPHHHTDPFSSRYSREHLQAGSGECTFPYFTTIGKHQSIPGSWPHHPSRYGLSPAHPHFFIVCKGFTIWPCLSERNLLHLNTVWPSTCVRAYNRAGMKCWERGERRCCSKSYRLTSMATHLSWKASQLRSSILASSRARYKYTSHLHNAMTFIRRHSNGQHHSLNTIQNLLASSWL